MLEKILACFGNLKQNNIKYLGTSMYCHAKSKIWGIEYGTASRMWKLSEGWKKSVHSSRMSILVKLSMQVWAFYTSDAWDYSFLPSDLPILPWTSPSDSPGHISASTGPRPKYDTSICNFVSIFRKEFISFIRSTFGGKTRCQKLKTNWSFFLRGALAGLTVQLAGLAHCTSNKSWY